MNSSFQTNELCLYYPLKITSLRCSSLHNFRDGILNTKWVTDITSIPTTQGWLSLAVILDLYSRAVVGWSISDCCDGQ